MAESPPPSWENAKTVALDDFLVAEFHLRGSFHVAQFRPVVLLAAICFLYVFAPFPTGKLALFLKLLLNFKQ